jgi:hypothetical protein
MIPVIHLEELGSEAGGSRRCPITRRLGRLEQDRLRNREAEGTAGSQIDDELELRGQLDRQIARLGTLERQNPASRAVTREPMRSAQVRSGLR